MPCYRFLIFILILFLTACSAIVYQPKEGAIPDGYSGEKLDDGDYIVVYESYKKIGTQKNLQKLAMKRAAEMANEQGYGYFDVLSNDFEIYQDEVEFPSQTLRSTLLYAGGVKGMGGTSNQHSEDVVTVIPAYTKTYQIKKITLKLLLQTEINDKTFNVADYL